MKKLLIIYIILFVKFAESGQKYLFELNGSFTESIKLLPDKSSFSSIKTYGAFSDNLGNIGKYDCDGVRESQKNGKLINLNILCEIVDKDLDKFWIKATRETDKAGGVGTYYILEGTGKFRKIIGKKCTYAVTFFNEIIFIKAVC